MSSHKAYVNPEILKWAREKRGFDINLAAKKIGVKVKKLHDAENGIDNITMNQLITAANVYKRAIATFYINNVPEDKVLPDFRGKHIEYSGDLDVVIREFKYELEELYPHLHSKYKFNFNYVGELSQNSKIEDIVEKISEILKAERNSYIKLKDNDVLNYWRGLFENNGIMTSQFSDIPSELTRGFTFASEPHPLIGLNKSDSYYARVFTLIHELVHILFGQTGICDVEKTSQKQRQIEVVCNSAAAEYLLPGKYIIENYDEEITNLNEIKKEMNKLSNLFKISYSVIGYKFISHNIISRSNLRVILENLEEERNKRLEFGRIQRKKRGGQGNIYNTYQSEKGKLFISMMFDAVKLGIYSDYKMMSVAGLTEKGFSYFQHKWDKGGFTW